MSSCAGNSVFMREIARTQQTPQPIEAAEGKTAETSESDTINLRTAGFRSRVCNQHAENRFPRGPGDQIVGTRRLLHRKAMRDQRRQVELALAP